MIYNESADNSLFGTGRLLDDLIEYVYGAEGCRMLLIGDNAQLPPVKQVNSPALDREVLRSYSLQVMSSTLTGIVRQAESSGILYNATMLRNALLLNETDQYPRLRVRGFTDVQRVTGVELIDEIGDAYRRDGLRRQ